MLTYEMIRDIQKQDAFYDRIDLPIDENERYLEIQRRKNRARRNIGLRMREKSLVSKTNPPTASEF